MAIRQGGTLTPPVPWPQGRVIGLHHNHPMATRHEGEGKVVYWQEGRMGKVVYTSPRQEGKTGLHHYIHMAYKAGDTPL
jgi:hypothetical protein